MGGCRPPVTPWLRYCKQQIFKPFFLSSNTVFVAGITPYYLAIIAWVHFNKEKREFAYFFVSDKSNVSLNAPKNIAEYYNEPLSDIEDKLAAKNRKKKMILKSFERSKSKSNGIIFANGCWSLQCDSFAKQ